VDGREKDWLKIASYVGATLLVVSTWVGLGMLVRNGTLPPGRYPIGLVVFGIIIGSFVLFVMGAVLVLVGWLLVRVMRGKR